MEPLVETSPETQRADEDPDETDNYFVHPLNSTANSDINEEVLNGDPLMNFSEDDELRDLTAEEAELQRQISEAQARHERALRRQRVAAQGDLRQHLIQLQNETLNVETNIERNTRRPTHTQRPVPSHTMTTNATAPDHSYANVDASLPARGNSRSSSRSSSLDRVLEVIKHLNLGPNHNNGPKPAVFKQPPPKFNGDREQAIDWLKEYKAIARINNWDNRNKSTHLITALIDDAKTWFDGIFDGRTPAWDEFENAFMEVYKPIDYECEVRQKVYTLRQNIGETPTAFLNRLIKESNRVTPKMSEIDIMAVLKKGLHFSYAEAIIRDETIVSARKTLTSIEKIRGNRDRVRNQNQNNPQKPNNSSNTNQRYNQNTNYRNRPNASQPNESKADKPKSEVEPQTQTEFKYICFNCGNRGHAIRDCTAPRDNAKIKESLEKWRARGQGSSQNTNASAQTVPKTAAPAPVIPSDPTQIKSITVNARKRSSKSNDKSSKRMRVTDPDHFAGNQINTLTASGDYLQTMAKCMTHRHMPYVCVLIGEIGVDALLDTGSALTYCSKYFASRVGLKLESWPFNGINVAGGQMIKPSGLVPEVRIVYGRYAITMPMGVIDNLRPHVILGMDFLRTARITITPAFSLAAVSEEVFNKTQIRKYGRREYWPFERSDASEEEIQMLADRINEDSNEPNIKRVQQLNGGLGEALTESDNSSSSQSFVSGSDSSYTTDNEGSEPEIEGPNDSSIRIMIPSKSSQPVIASLVPPKCLPSLSEQRVKLRLNEPLTGLFHIELCPEMEGSRFGVHSGVVECKDGVTEVVVRNKLVEPFVIDKPFPLCIVTEIEGHLICPKNRSPEEVTGADIERLFEENSLIMITTDEVSEEKSNNNERDVLTRNEGEKTSVLAIHSLPTDLDDYLSYFNIGETLNTEQKERLGQLLVEYRNRFVFEGDNLGRVQGTVHYIDTGDARPASHAPYRVSKWERDEIEKQVEQMLSQGIIEPVSSSWASPVVIVGKRDKSLRFCVDYRELNRLTKDDKYPLPRLDDALDMLGGNTMFTTLDACSAYWQIEVANQDREKTTFVCHMGTFQFNFMPFGLKNAPATMSRAMDKIFAKQNRKSCLVYLDDLITFSKDFDSHYNNLSEIFKEMAVWDLKLKPSKCYFAQEHVSYLGHLISADGIIPDPDRTSAFAEFPIPKNVRGIRSFLGFASFYRRFIYNFSKIAQPLNRLLKKDIKFNWGVEQQQAFETIKRKVLNPPVLAHYDPKADLILRTDACTYGLGGHLIQVPPLADRSKGQLLACTSRTLGKAEQNYSITDLECLAIVFSVEKFRPYLYGRRFLIETDHHALCFLMKKQSPAGRLCRWAQYLQKYDFSIKYCCGKEHADADCLSRYPLRADPKDLDRDYCQEIAPKCPLMAIEVTSEVNQSVPERGAAQAVEQTRAEGESSINSMADEQMKDRMWSNIYDIKKSGNGSNAKNRRIQSHYVLQSDVLYKRVISGGEERYLLCVPETRITSILQGCHDCPTAGHLGRDKTRAKIYERYFWPTIKRDTAEYVMSCHKCQIRKSGNRPPFGLYQPLPIPEEIFSEISLDLVGPLTETDKGNKYILTINDRLSKFAFAKALPDIKDRTVMNAFITDWVLLFGPPNTLLTDRGSNLCSAYSENIYSQYSVKHLRTTASHPETNGQTEVFNKTLADMLSTLSGDNRNNWDLYIDSAVYAYNTSIHSFTKQTPYGMVFGRRARLPVDGETGYTELRDRSLFRADQVIEAQAKRTRAKKSLEQRQQINKRIANKNRLKCVLNEGERVLLRETTWQRQKGGKLLPRFSGPYVVHHRFSDNVYEIITESGPPATAVVNIRRLKQYKPRERNIPEEELIDTHEPIPGEFDDLSVHSSDDSDVYLNDSNLSDSSVETLEQSLDEPPIELTTNQRRDSQSRVGRKRKAPKHLEDFFLFEILP